MGALTHNGEVLQSLPADASQINFDNTGTNLNSTQTENAIKEVNTKVNTNTEDITQLKSGLTPQEQFTALLNTEVVEDNGQIGVYKVGRLVFVFVEYKPKSGAIAPGAVIASQLPTPAKSWLLSDSITQLILDNTDGSLKFWYPSDTTTLTRRDFAFSYVSAS